MKNRVVIKMSEVKNIQNKSKSLLSLQNASTHHTLIIRYDVGEILCL